MITLYFDTETTGKLVDYLSPTINGQPRLVQLGAILADDDQEIATMSQIIKPDGWTISDEAARVHGITQERAERDGVPIEEALKNFEAIAAGAEEIVAFNMDFDAMVLRIESHVYSRPIKVPPVERFCAMRAATNPCQIPKMRRGKFCGYKWPKLEEAHDKLIGKPLEGAHDALADARGAMRVWRKLRTLGVV